MRLLEPTGGEHPLRGPRHRAPAGRRRCRALRRELADGLPGSLLLAEPPPDRRLDRRPSPSRSMVCNPIARARRRPVQELMDTVGLNPEHYNRYPHEFSGGSASASALRAPSRWSPKLLIADEPVSALDVSIQAQILNLLRELQRELGLTLLFRSPARPLGRALHLRTRRRHVPRQDRRDRPRRAALPRAVHPYTRGCSPPYPSFPAIGVRSAGELSMSEAVRSTGDAGRAGEAGTQHR